MSILSAIKQQSNSIEDLAKLPQTMIMQMAQRKEIVPEMVPVILGKKAEMIDRAAKAKAAGEGIPQQSVMDQIMSSNAQAENPQEMGQMPPPMPQQNQMAQRPPMMQQPQQPQGPADVGIASNPVPPMQMAGGGIIAFDDGGDVDSDEDYQEAIDDANQESMNSQIYEMINQLKMPEKSTNIGILSGYQTPEKTPESKQTNNSLKEIINAKANEYKIPAELMQKIASSESGGKANAANPLSSAKGLFQFTDATWVGMGGKPGEQFDPEKNAELGAKFIRQNAEGLKKAFGRDPTYGEIYAANHFGLKGAKDLLSMDPRTPMEEAVSGLVLKQNPQLRGHTVGQVMAGLNKKTGDGIVSLARGGAIQHYDDGGEIERIGGELDALRSATQTMEEAMRSGGSRGGAIAPELRAGYENALKLRNERQKEYEALMNKTDVNKAAFNYQSSLNPVQPEPNKKVQKAVKEGNAVQPNPRFPPANAVPSTDAMMEADQGGGAPPKEVPVEEKPTRKLTAAEEDQFNLMNYIKQRQASIDKASMDDKNMALLAAGMGMMAGTSPYAFSNIGAGGLQGVQQLAASQKLRASQEAAMGKLYGSASQAEMLNRLRQDTLSQRKDESLKTDLDRARDNLRLYVSAKEAQLEKKYPKEQRQFNEKMAKSYDSELNAIKFDNEYLDLYKDAFPSRKGSTGFKLVGTR